MIDYHIHLHDHGESGPYSLDRIRTYVDVGASRGVHELGFTEHVFRFHEVVDLLGAWWEDEPDPALRDYCERYFAEHATQSLDDYVESIQEARAAGLPVRIGVEVDHYPGRMVELAELLDGYPIDFRLGSVHWLGGWGFDDPAVADRWAARDVDETWGTYLRSVAELIETRTIDVLAHPDLVKKFGHRPDEEPVDAYEAVLAAAERAGVAIEVSSAGLRKPVQEAYPSAEFLRRASARNLPITTASDAHSAEDVGRDLETIRALAENCGYAGTVVFDRRERHDVDFEGGSR